MGPAQPAIRRSGPGAVGNLRSVVRRCHQAPGTASEAVRPALGRLDGGRLAVGRSHPHRACPGADCRAFGRREPRAGHRDRRHERGGLPRTAFRPHPSRMDRNLRTGQELQPPRGRDLAFGDRVLPHQPAVWAPSGRGCQRRTGWIRGASGTVGTMPYWLSAAAVPPGDTSRDRGCGAGRRCPPRDRLGPSQDRRCDRQCGGRPPAQRRADRHAMVSRRDQGAAGTVARGADRPAPGGSAGGPRTRARLPDPGPAVRWRGAVAGRRRRHGSGRVAGSGPACAGRGAPADRTLERAGPVRQHEERLPRRALAPGDGRADRRAVEHRQSSRRLARAAGGHARLVGRAGECRRGPAATGPCTEAQAATARCALRSARGELNSRQSQPQLEGGELTLPEWVSRLLTSPVFEEQKRLGGRGLPADDVFAKLLGTLDRRGGKLTSVALARALAFPALRLSGLLAKAQRVLNIDGYAVLSRDDASDTVELNRELLLKQFDLV